MEPFKRIILLYFITILFGNRHSLFGGILVNQQNKSLAKKLKRQKACIYRKMQKVRTLKKISNGASSFYLNPNFVKTKVIDNRQFIIYSHFDILRTNLRHF